MIEDEKEDLRRIRAAVGKLLVPSHVRARMEPRVPEQAALSTVCELYMVAFTMEPSVRPAGIRIAAEAAERMGLVPEEVHDFTLEILATANTEMSNE